MQSAFAIVVFAVVAVAVVVGLVTAAGAGRAYAEIGRGDLSLGDDTDRMPRPPGAAATAVREEELRQLLAARSAARVRNGKPPLDVDAELALVLRPAIDPALVAEIRDLVIARNARRVRRGETPLDIEAEVERQVAALG